jgi:hypothetical protein
MYDGFFISYIVGEKNPVFAGLKPDEFTGYGINYAIFIRSRKVGAGKVKTYCPPHTFFG